MTARDFSHIDSLDQVPLPACRLLPDTTLVEANDAYLALFGDCREQLLGQRIADCLTPENADYLRHTIARMQPDDPWSLSAKQLFRGARRDQWLMWHDVGVFDDRGELQHVLGFCWETTEEIRYSNALERLIRLTSDRTLEAEQMLSGILAIGCDFYDTGVGVITEVTDKGARPVYTSAPEDVITLGTTLELANSYASIATEEGRVVAIDDLSKTPYTDRPFYSRNPLVRFLSAEIHVDGKRYGTISFSSRRPSERAFSEYDREFCKLLVQWVSITLARMNKMAEISRNEELYRQIFEDAPIAMHLIRRDGIITDINAMWTEKFGYAREEIIGHALTERMTPEQAEIGRRNIAASFARPTTSFSRTLPHKDGSLVELEVMTFRMPKELDGEVLVAMNDVTDRNRAQRSLTRSNDELSRANEGLKRFNAVAAHDLQEPLRKIGIYGGILREKLITSDNADVLESLSVVLRSSERLSKLVKDLLTYSKQTGRDYASEPVDLSAVLQGVLGDLDLMIREANAEIRVDPLPLLNADSVPIERLFNNLINNALTYRRLGYPPEIRVFATTLDNGDLEITVRDNGIGVPEDGVEKIFEPFARLQPTAFSGTGIGLAMCKSIAEGHGWSIRAHPRKDAPGSDFVLTIPRAAVIGDAAPMSAVPMSAAKAPDQS